MCCLHLHCTVSLYHSRLSLRYQDDDTWLGRSFDPTSASWSADATALQGGGGDDGSSSGGGGRRRTGWWREDDPYWMLRDWGDHPMRWWTLVYAALVAGGSVRSRSLLKEEGFSWTAQNTGGIADSVLPAA